MSDPIDIKALDEYLKGDSEISQRYRELGREDVPSELDRRVLDEARAAVADNGRARARSWLRWSAPLALAASVVLVVTVVIESGMQNDTSFAIKTASDVSQADESKLQEQAAELPPSSPRPEQFVPEEPEPAAIVLQSTPAAAPASAPPPADLAKTEKERSSSFAREEVRVDAKASRDKSQAPLPVSAVSSEVVSNDAQLAARQPVPTLAGSAAVTAERKQVDRAAAEADSADDDVSEVAVTGNRVRRAPGRTAGPRNTVSSSALSSERRPAADADAEQSDREQSDKQQSDPEHWLEQIRDLRRAGKAVDADREWQRFREAFPDFRVAADDIARKKP